MPLTDTLPTCVIARCEQERSGLKALCSYHVAKHRRDAPDEPVEEWTPQQTPFLRARQFSLIPFPPVMRWEMLYALQQRDSRGGKIDPTLVRMLAGLLGDRPHLLGADRSELMALVHTKTCTGASAHTNEIYRAVHVGYEEMRGIKPTDKLVWHLPSIKAPSRKSKTGRARSTHGELDFTAITQPWLRDLTLEWARHIDPSLEVLRDTFRAAVLVSGALNQRPGGAMDPARLTAADMDAAVDAVRRARRKDGEIFTRNSARSMAHKLFALLDFGRRTGLMADVPTAFARHHRRHSIGHDDEDENGKAIPEPVIAQLDAHLETLGAGIPYGRLTDDEVRHMLRTAYALLRDTGRRPREICSLESRRRRPDRRAQRADGPPANQHDHGLLQGLVEAEARRGLHDAPACHRPRRQPCPDELQHRIRGPLRRGPVRQLHGAVERQGRRNCLPDPLPVFRLRFLSPGPVLPPRDRGTHQLPSRRPRDCPGDGCRRLRHP
ncbi:hypothetical protein [Streptomyces sp. NPDC016172]|uniref:hypothetical protein n=1 Tax=Streptomyces sp. NPDC016172 TaxID=3364964 RepID=UPI0036FBA8E8